MANLFDLDGDLANGKAEKAALLKRANALVIREEYERALEIYESILDEDDECLEAYLGILRVYSEDYTKFVGEKIDKYIRVINKLFDEIEDEDYLDFLKRRKRYLAEHPVEETKEEKPSPAPNNTFKQPETNLSIWDEDFKNGKEAAKKVVYISGKPIDTENQQKAERLLAPYINAQFPEAYAFMICSHFFSERAEWIRRAVSVFKGANADNKYLVYIFVNDAKLKLQNRDYEGFEMEMSEVANSGYYYAYFMVGKEYTEYPQYRGYDSAKFAKKAINFLVKYLETEPKRYPLITDASIWGDESYSQLADNYLAAKIIYETYEKLGFEYDKKNDYTSEIKKWKRISKLMQDDRSYVDALKEYENNPIEEINVSEDDEDFVKAINFILSKKDKGGFIGSTYFNDEERNKYIDILTPYADAGSLKAISAICTMSHDKIPVLLKGISFINKIDLNNHYHIYFYFAVAYCYYSQKKDIDNALFYLNKLSSVEYMYAYQEMQEACRYVAQYGGKTVSERIALNKSSIEYGLKYLKTPFKPEYRGSTLPPFVDESFTSKHFLRGSIYDIAYAYADLGNYSETGKDNYEKLYKLWLSAYKELENNSSLDPLEVLAKKGIEL